MSPLPKPQPPLRYVSASEVLRRVDLAAAVSAVADAFRAQADGAYESPDRLVLGDGRMLVMAARSRGDGDGIVKALRVDTHGERRPGAGPTIDGIVLWLGRAGEPALAVDAGAVTALRTAAVAAVATERLAEPNASRLTLLSAGRQGREQVRAIGLVRPIDRVTIWNRTPTRACELAADLAHSLPGVVIEVTDNPDIAVRDADIVCCATAATEPLFPAAAIRPSAHVNAIGAYRPDMHELPGELFVRASLVAVDDIAGCASESGEVIDAITGGQLDRGDLCELSALLVTAPERGGITVFKSVGVAIADLAVTETLVAALVSSEPGVGALVTSELVGP